MEKVSLDHGEIGPLSDETMCSMSDSDETNNIHRSISAIAHIVEAFDALAATGSVRLTEGSNRIFKAAYGWWVHIIRGSQAIALLYDNGLSHETAPNVRSLLEHAVALRWLVETGDHAVDAVKEYGDSKHRELREAMQQANWPTIPGLDMRSPTAPDPPCPDLLL